MHPLLIGIYFTLALGLAVLTFLVFEPCRKETVRRGKAVVRSRRSFCRPSHWPHRPMMGGPLPYSYQDTWLVTLSVDGSLVDRTVDPKLYERLLSGTTVDVIYGRGIITNRVRIIELEV